MKEIKLKGRARKVKTNLLESAGKSLRSAMLKAGYNLGYANNPQEFAKTRAGKEIGKWLEFEIQQIEQEMHKKRKQAKYKDLADTLHNFKKLKNLIEGNPTEIQEVRGLEEAIKKIAGNSTSQG